MGNTRSILILSWLGRVTCWRWGLDSSEARVQWAVKAGEADGAARAWVRWVGWVRGAQSLDNSAAAPALCLRSGGRQGKWACRRATDADGWVNATLLVASPRRPRPPQPDPGTNRNLPAHRPSPVRPQAHCPYIPLLPCQLSSARCPLPAVRQPFGSVTARLPEASPRAHVLFDGGRKKSIGASLWQFEWRTGKIR
jgi:hypothetical protein